jgi:LytS/YehU family sensor histidine kinase
VENAIRHGLSTTPRAVTIEIRGRFHGDRLLLSVSDDGDGADPAGLREGIGLGNLRDRLQQMFGHQQSMRIETGAGQGFTVTLELPRRATEAAP